MNSRFSQPRLNQACSLLRRWVDEGHLPGVAAAVGSSAGIEIQCAYGQQVPGDAPPLREDAIFLIASPTKPVTALGVMLLVERGELKLTDRIATFVPDFAAENKDTITIAHCLTHTSGLPDMPPDNVALRARRAPLEDYLASACAVRPDFAPGTGHQYQSLGSLMLAEVVHQVVGEQLGQFLDREIFQPLEMHDTVLGMPPSWEQTRDGARREDRIAHVRLPDDGHSAVWNTTYWRRLGVPWGGLLSTPGDWARLCRHLLRIHAGHEGVLSRGALTAMTTNQLHAMPRVPETVRRCQPWGLGWRLNWPHDVQTFGDLLSPAAYGHWGATGTLVWIDPVQDLFAVVLTTEPLNFSTCRLPQFSNAVCASLRQVGR